MDKNDLCLSCNRKLEPGLSECPDCGTMTPLRVSLDPKAWLDRALVIAGVILLGVLIKIFLFAQL